MPSPSHRYDLIAIDLDGTLLCPKGKVSPVNLEAVHRARSAGVRTTVCTGRGMIECRHITGQIGQVDPVVVAGGAILACPVRCETIHRFPMPPALVRRLVNSMTAHGHAALILKDPSATRAVGTDGHDYVVVSPRGEAGIDPVTRWWFDALKVPVKVVTSLDQDEHPEHTVRVGICGTRRTTAGAAEEVAREFCGEVTLHHFAAVGPGGVGADSEDCTLILEAFDRTVSKWTAIEWLARREGIAPERIAAIGNDINDVAMLERAGLAVAMGNAIPECRAVAHRHTLDNETDGVAHAIDHILAGRW